MAIGILTGTTIFKSLSQNNNIVVENAFITIRDLNGQLKTLFSDSAGTVPIGNPFTADSSGQWYAYSESEFCLVTVSKGGVENTYQTVVTPIGENTIQCTPRDFGAVGNGADDRLALIAAGASGKHIVIDEVYLSSAQVTITRDTYWSCKGEGKIEPHPSTPDNMRMVRVEAEHFDSIVSLGGEKAVNTVYFPPEVDYPQQGNYVEYGNITLNPTAGNSNAGCTIFSSKVSIRQVYGHDMVNGGHPNGSMPQGMVWGTGQYNVVTHELENGRSGFLTITDSKGTLGSNSCRELEDNGCYILGGENLNIGDLFYEGNEEPLVMAGVLDLTIDNHNITNRCSGSVNYQNIGKVIINNVNSRSAVPTTDPEFAQRMTTSMLLARSGNVSSGEITINNYNGDFQRGLYTNSGRLRKLTIGRGKFSWNRNPSGAPLNQWPVNPTNFNLWDMRGVDQIDISNLDITIKNHEATDWPAGIMTVFHPIFTKESSIKNIFVRIVENDDTEASTAIEWRNGRPQEFLLMWDMYWELRASNVNAVRARQAGYQLNSINGTPTNGYWWEGQELKDRSNYSTGFKCGNTGETTSADWDRFGNINGAVTALGGPESLPVGWSSVADTNQGVGAYVVTHNFGSQRYKVDGVVPGLDGDAKALVENKSNNTFTIFTYNSSGIRQNLGFNFSFGAFR